MIKNTPKKWSKLLVFLCDECLEETKKQVLYSYENGNAVPFENLDIVLCPKDYCENHYDPDFTGVQKPIRLYDEVTKPYIIEEFETFDQAINSSNNASNEKGKSFGERFKDVHQCALNTVETSEKRAIKISVMSNDKIITICFVARINDGKVTTFYFYH